MDWLGQLFGLIGGSQENIQKDKQLQEADRLRKGKQTESKNTSIYIFVGLLAVALVLAYMNKK